MSAVDLSRLIIRKKYFISLKPSELEAAILNELGKCDPSFYDVEAWGVSERHMNGWEFLFNMIHMYVIGHSTQPRTKEMIEKLAKEFRGNYKQKYFEQLESSTGGSPHDLRVFVTRTETNGCVVEVALKPLLYNKIVQLGTVPKEYEIQNAYLASEEFLRAIFESGLSATIVSEEKLRIPKPPMEFLINDSYTRQITEKLEKMLEEATNEILIMGWIGTIFIDKFKELKQKGVNIFVITGNVKEIREDPMRKEKERAFGELLSIMGKANVSKKPEFHGRMVIVDNKALIGSADLDSYSLTGTRIEFAAYTEDPSIVLSLRSYFKNLFSPMKETSQ